MALEEKMIDPFADRQVSTGVKPRPVNSSHGTRVPKLQGLRRTISYGLSSYGYDLRLADEFKVVNAKNPITQKRNNAKNDSPTVIDPKNFDPKLFTEFKGKECLIPAHSFILARSLEYFRIPRNILTLCFGKSTYARCGIIVNVTPFEPEWEGYATIEITNTAPYPAKIYAAEGVAQIVFLESDEMCEISYADKKGRYQAQKKITLPRT